MSKHEIDIMWQKAMCQSIEDGEMFTRYHFAKLVAERALADSMRKVQRLGQEIEQEPPQRPWVGLTDEEREELTPYKGSSLYEYTYDDVLNILLLANAKLRSKN